ncbi:MAG: ABC transporter permease [Actinomycetota bacterium]|nr:ABC transporter permease [Actinomycetota bacterium]
MWKVTFKGLAGHKLRFLLTALAVILGVSFIAGTLVLTATIQKTFDDLFADINRGTDAAVRAHEVFSDFGGGQRPNIPASLVGIVRQTPTVEAAVGNIQAFAQVVDKHGNVIGGNGPPTFGLGWDPNPKLNPFHLVVGHPPQADDQIVIDKNTADKGAFHVGDRVTVLTTKAPRQYQLVGIARFGTVDSLAGASITLFTPREMQRVANVANEYSQISVVAKPGVSQTQVASDIGRTLAARGEGQYEVITGKALTKESQDSVHKALGFITTALLVFAFVALIVGMFIIYNTFSIVVAQRMREMALLRAIGATQRQVLGSVIGESVVVGVLASAIGVGVGVLLSIGLKSLMNALGFGIPGNGVVLKPSAVVIGLLVGSIVTIFSATIPARQAARVPPIAAMRAVALERPINRFRRVGIGGAILALGVALLFSGLYGGSGLLFVGVGALLMLVGVFVLSPLFARQLARVIGVPLTKLRGIVGSLARENAARNPRRTATTGAAVMIAVSLVGFITIFAASANASIGSAIDQQLKTDYIVTLKGGGGGNPVLSGISPLLARSIAARPEIQASTPVRLGDVSASGSRTFVGAADPKQISQLYDFGAVAGSVAALTPNGIAVSTRKASSKHLKLGDLIPVKFVKTGVVPLRVEFIYKNNTLVGDYVVSLANYERNFAQQLDFLIYAKLKPGVTARQGRDAIEPLVAKYPNAQLKDNAQYKADQKKQVNQVLLLVYVLLFLAVIIAFIGIVNTMTLSIYERTREIGLLRAVGSARRQVRSMVRWEAAIIALFGTLLGLLMALVLGWAVVRALHDQGFTKFSAAPLQLFVIVVVTAIATLIWASLPARRAARLDVLRAIDQE